MASRSAALGTAREWAIDLAFATLAGAVLGVLGPFGSYFNASAGVRVLYWIAQLWFGMAVMGVCVRLAAAWSRRHGVPVWIALGAAALLGSAPIALGAAFAGRWAWGRYVAHVTPVEWYLEALAISAILVPVRVWLWPWSGVRLRGAAPAEARPAPGGDFAPEGLASALSGEVLCLQMEDHYVRVHRPGGSRLALGTLGEAMALLNGRDGLQVHRSWWVARDAVARVVQEGRNVRLELSNGKTAPVSRAAVARLKAAGWMT
jgi:hypothetical protein